MSNANGYQFYPGCSLKTMARPYERSIRAIFRILGIPLTEIDNWSCCSATPMLSLDQDASRDMASRNIRIAEKAGNDVLVACSACFKYLRASAGTVRVRNILDVLVNEIGIDRIAKSVTHPLSGIAVAPYYGCYVSRPKPSFEDKDDPQTMDLLIKAAGATLIDFRLKTFCCGGTLMAVEGAKAAPLIGKLLYHARDLGADCIITPCPLCHMNLDKYQGDVNKELGTDHKMPILYFTQLLGLAMGLGTDEVGLTSKWLSAIGIEKNFVSTRCLMDKIKGGSCEQQ